jgi:hypothetical protein
MFSAPPSSSQSAAPIDPQHTRGMVMMLDRNNLDIADLIMSWIDSHT